VKAGTVDSTLSTAANVTIEIRDAGGALVRTLLAGAARDAGSVSGTWDRKDAGGRKARSGTYVAEVRAVASDGRSARTTATFKVS
jgi:flagellar hook assembly protein FlgD